MTGSTPPAGPPSFGEVFGLSLRAFARAPSVFATAALRPAPSAMTVAGLTMACAAAAVALALAPRLAADPAFFQRFPPAMVAVVGAAALVVYASLALVSAVLLYGLGRALTGAGDFARALQAVAALSLLAPVQAVCSQFDFVWVLPALLAAWVAAGALEGFFQAKPLAARSACALLAAAAIGLQSAGRVVYERVAQAYALTQAAGLAFQAEADLARKMQAVSVPEATGTAPPGVSGLDLLRAPAADSPAAASAEAAASQPPEDAEGLERQAVAMLDSIAPMLENPAVARNLSPRQKADMKELQTLMKELRAQMQPGARRPSGTEQARRMERIQALTLRMMSAGATPPASSKNEVPQ